MVEKFKTILEALRKKGSIILFAVLKMDDLTDKWSVLICASWITDEESRNNAFNEIRELIKRTMTPEERAAIARIVVASKEEHLIQELLENKPGTYIGEQLKINGNVIHEAYILESAREA